MQWKLPSSVSSFVQRAGRAARARNRTGLAVLLVEKSVYDFDISGANGQQKKGKGKQKGVRQTLDYPKGKKGHAFNHGVLRGGYTREFDHVLAKEDVPVDYEAPDEGLYALAQTGKCRRLLLTGIYKNDLPSELLRQHIHLYSQLTFDANRTHSPMLRRM